MYGGSYSADCNRECHAPSFVCSSQCRLIQSEINADEPRQTMNVKITALADICLGSRPRIANQKSG